MPQGPAFSHPGVNLRFAFEADSLDLELEDFGTAGVTSTNYYSVLLDGGAPWTFKAETGRHRYPLLRQLKPGPHVVELFKETESSPQGNREAGRGIFRGIYLTGGKDLLPLAPRKHRVEFVGDSIACGYGTRLSTATPDLFKFTSANASAWLAWGAVAARSLEAEYVAVAHSGTGIYRNYAGAASEKAPDYYLDIFPDGQVNGDWDTQRYHPHVLVVNLGTNDFSSLDLSLFDCEQAASALTGEACLNAMLDAAHVKYRAANEAFLVRLRGYYPDAELFIATSPMVSDFYPTWNVGTAAAPVMRATQASTRIAGDLVAIQPARAAAGDTRVSIINVRTQSSPYGEDWHPTAATQAADGEQAATTIRSKLGW